MLCSHNTSPFSRPRRVAATSGDSLLRLLPLSMAAASVRPPPRDGHASRSRLLAAALLSGAAPRALALSALASALRCAGWAAAPAPSLRWASRVSPLTLRRWHVGLGEAEKERQGPCVRGGRWGWGFLARPGSYAPARVPWATANEKKRTAGCGPPPPPSHSRPPPLSPLSIFSVLALLAYRSRATVASALARRRGDAAKRAALLAAMGAATTYEAWSLAATRLDALDGLDPRDAAARWARETSLYDRRLLKSRTAHLRAVRAGGDVPEMAFALRTDLLRTKRL